MSLLRPLPSYQDKSPGGSSGQWLSNTPYSLSRLLWKLANCQVPKQAYPFSVAMELAVLSTPQSRGPGMASQTLLWFQ